MALTVSPTRRGGDTGSGAGSGELKVEEGVLGAEPSPPGGCGVASGESNASEVGQFAG